MKIIDLSAGQRAIWFNKNNPVVTFIDIRPEVCPTFVADSTKLPAEIGSDYDLIVFDPPHMNCGKNSNMSRVYGHHTTKRILEIIEGTSREAARISKPNSLLVLKWNDHDIKLQKVLALMPQWEPLCGHLTKDGPGSKTYWALLKKVG